MTCCKVDHLVCRSGAFDSFFHPSSPGSHHHSSKCSPFLFGHIVCISPSYGSTEAHGRSCSRPRRHLGWNNLECKKLRQVLSSIRELWCAIGKRTGVRMVWTKFERLLLLQFYLPECRVTRLWQGCKDDVQRCGLVGRDSCVVMVGAASPRSYTTATSWPGFIEEGKDLSIPGWMELDAASKGIALETGWRSGLIFNICAGSAIRGLEGISRQIFACSVCASVRAPDLPLSSRDLGGALCAQTEPMFAAQRRARTVDALTRRKLAGIGNHCASGSERLNADFARLVVIFHPSSLHSY